VQFIGSPYSPQLYCLPHSAKQWNYPLEKADATLRCATALRNAHQVKQRIPLETLLIGDGKA